MPVPEHNVAREKGNGSRSALEDEKTGDIWETKDQRAETRTTFYERDIDKLNVSDRRKRQLKRALKRQEGQHVNSKEYDSRGQQNHREDKRRLIGSFAGQLELTPAQKKRVNHLVMDVISVNSFGSYSSEQVILAVVNVVAREDGRWIEDEDDFRVIMENVGIDGLETMKRLRSLVRDRIPSRQSL